VKPTRLSNLRRKTVLKIACKAIPTVSNSWKSKIPKFLKKKKKASLYE